MKFKVKFKAGVLVLIGVVLIALDACGEAADAGSLDSYVGEAMAGLPYEYRMMAGSQTDDYVVFKMVNPRNAIDVNVAFGLPSTKNTCSKPPRLPARHRKGFHPYFGAAGVPMLCLADDARRPVDSREESAIRGRMASLVSTALCNAVYDKEEFEDFACFD